VRRRALRGGAAAAVLLGAAALLLAVAGTSAMADPSPSPLPDASCSREGAIRSTSGSTRVSLEFINLTGEPLQAIWLNYQGKRVLYGQVAPGQSVAQGTFVTHVWILADPAGTCLKLFVATGPGESVTVSSPPGPTLPGATALPGPVAGSQPTTSKPPPAHAAARTTSAGTDARFGASSLAASITSPSVAFSSVSLTLVNALIALAVLLFITFPAHLFNHTFQENYDEIVAGVQRRLPWLVALRTRLLRGATDRRRQVIVFASVVLGGGLLGGLLSPNFGINLTTVASYVATVVSVLVGASLSFVVGWAYRRVRHREHEARLQALPFGLAVAALCVVISRLADFRPGYLYGVVAGVAFGTALGKRENGHVVALATLTTMAVAILAWLAWVPVNAAAAQDGAGFAVTFADDLLGALFVGGLVGSVIGLIPLNFMPGGALAAWHRGVWAVTFGLALFGVVELLLHPQKGDAHPGGAPVVTVIALLVFFGGSSLVFAGYFARRHRKMAAAAEPSS